MNIQKPVVWAIASATLIGASLTTYAMAQERTHVAAKQGTGNAAATSAVPSTPKNAATHLLQFALSESHNALLNKTNDAQLHARIIEASNRAVFAAQSLEEQEAYRKLIDIEKRAPNKSVWREIASTKSMLNALLKITPEQHALAEKVTNAIWDKITKPTPEVIKQTPILGLTQAEKLRERENPVASKYIQIHGKWLNAQIEDACKQVRATLTADQKAEWDAIWALYQKHLPTITP